MERHTVTITVNGHNAGEGTTVTLSGSGYYETEMGTWVTFNNVPDGWFSARAQCGNSEGSVDVHVNGSDVTANIDL